MAGQILDNADFELATGNNFDTWTEHVAGSSTVTANTTDPHSGTKCVEITSDGTEAAYIRQIDLDVEVGQEYTIKFWAKSVSGGADCYISGLFTSSVYFTLTTEWKRYTHTGIVAATILNFLRWSGHGGTFLADDFYLTGTPARYAVVTGALPKTIAAFTDFTKSDFGTVKAAIVITGNAAAGSNPIEHAINSVGYWDGTRQNCAYAGINNGEGTAVNARGLYDGRIAIISIAPSDYTARYEISNTTNGVRITMMEGSTGYERYATVLLIAGHDVEAYCDTRDIVSSHPTMTGVGFKPTAILTAGAGTTTSSASSTYHIWSMGGAVYRPTLQQFVLHNFDYTGRTTMVNNTLVDNTKMTGQLSTSYTWSSALNWMNHDGFVFTNTGTGGGDDITFLALKTPGINIDMRTLQIPDEVGSQSITGVGFKPGAVMAFMGGGKTENVKAQNISSSVGMSDGTTDAAYGIRATDEVVTSDCASKYSASLVHLPTPSGDSYSNATLSSFDSDGYTFDWTDVTGSGNYGFAIAFQDQNDSKKLIGTAGGKIYFKQ